VAIVVGGGIVASFDWQQQPDPVFTNMDPFAHIAVAGHGEVWSGQTALIALPHFCLAKQVAVKRKSVKE
jgi:hypothetical protein